MSDHGVHGRLDFLICYQPEFKKDTEVLWDALGATPHVSLYPPKRLGKRGLYWTTAQFAAD